jgi:hypothetical protein
MLYLPVGERHTGDRPRGKAWGVGSHIVLPWRQVHHDVYSGSIRAHHERTTGGAPLHCHSRPGDACAAWSADHSHEQATHAPHVPGDRVLPPVLRGSTR